MTDMLRDRVELGIRVGSRVFPTAFRADRPSRWIDFEWELLDVGVPIALPHRAAWAEAHPHRRHWHVSVRNDQGTAEAVAVVSVEKSRVIPGWQIAQVERVGSAHTSGGRKALLLALGRIPSFEPRILRLLVGLFSEQPTGLRDGVEALSTAGFRKDPYPRSYRETLLLDLTPPESDLFSGLHRTARRHIRAVDKKPVSIRPIEDPSFASRMEALLRESFARTGKNAPVRDWAGLIRFSTKYPGLSRMVGLYQDEVPGPPGLLAFAWGCFHGDHAHYSAAGSTRDTDVRMPLTYGLMWELILWAKATGASFFDLGGITLEGTDSDDSRAGISRFKRYFASEVVEVGAEYVLEPHPTLASVSRAFSSASRWAKNGLRRPSGGF